jgi:hypothetical protein
VGSTVANVGILYGPVGMGRYGIPLGQSIDDTIGTALGCQVFLDGIESQLIFEVGARTSTKSEKEEGAVSFGARYQRIIAADAIYCVWIPLCLGGKGRWFLMACVQSGWLNSEGD